MVSIIIHYVISYPFLLKSLYLILNSNAKKVIDKETGIVYGSAKEVAIKFGINYSTLKSWLKNNKRGNRFEYYKK